MKLLLPVDLRSDADVVVARAIPWAAALGATVDVLFVAEDFSADDQDVLQTLLNRFPERLRGQAVVHASAKVAAAVGHLSTRYEVVAVGAARDPAAAPFWLGSVSERVARTCPASVLVLRGPAPRTPAPRLLFAVDPTTDNDPLLAAVARWAARLHAIVDLLIVDEFSLVRHIDEPKWEEMLTRAAATYRTQHLAALADVRERMFAPANRGQVFVDPGAAAAAIALRGSDYDLIAVGTHDRGPLARAVLGSVAERVVRRANGPVLVVRT